MLNLITAASTARQIANTDEAILAFAVITREPDGDVDDADLVWWLALQERMEIRAELAASGLL